MFRYLSLKTFVFATALALMAGAGSPGWAVPYQTGDIFAAVGSGLVRHYRADGTFVQDLDTTNGGHTTGMAFDGAGNLYVTNFTASRLAVFDNNGALTNSNFVTGLGTPESIVFDKTGHFFVGNLNNGIRKYNAAGGFLGTVINTRVDWFDLTADQGTFLYGQEGGNILTVSNALPGASGADFAAGLTQAFAMRILGDGGLLVADRVDIKRFDSAGALIQTYDATGVDAWFALNLNPDGTSFWSGSYADGILREFDIASGALLQTLNSSCGSSCLYGVTVFGEITVGGPPPGISVPEPSALLLFGVGLVGLAAAAFRSGRHGNA